MIQEKSSKGRFFEDYLVGEVIYHSTPRTMTDGDRSLYISIYSSRFASYCSYEFAKKIGFEGFPFEDLAVFHMVFGKTVPDISFNAIANLGYAEVKFFEPVFPGDTLKSESQVIGLKENSNGKSGVVYVETKGFNQNSKLVVKFKRWVMVRKRSDRLLGKEAVIPSIKTLLAAKEVPTNRKLKFDKFDYQASGEKFKLDDYTIGEKIIHGGGVTLDESEHILITRLWQNTSLVHFNINKRRDGRRIIYGGHIISMARAYSFNGLANAHTVHAINSGTHANPCFSGDTLYFWSEVLDKYHTDLPNYGLLRLRLIASKGEVETFEIKDNNNTYKSNIVLDLDYWVTIPS